MSQNSALYAGDVVHLRLRPRVHKLHYRVFSLLLDLDELPSLGASSKLFGYNRPAIFSFWDKDHGAGQGDLRAWVEARLRDAGHELDHPTIQILCYPRIWGYVFNPLTVYYCFDEHGAPRVILYEVGNTFGERRTYVIVVPEGVADTIRQRCSKAHYVSPFMPMDCTYDFRMQLPGSRVLVKIDESDADGPLLRASFSGRRQPLTDRTLFKALFAYPLMTLKVTGAIHWEALRLWLKRVPVFRHAAAPERIATTIVTPLAAHHPPGDPEQQPVRQPGQ